MLANSEINTWMMNVPVPHMYTSTPIATIPAVLGAWSMVVVDLNLYQGTTSYIHVPGTTMEECCNHTLHHRTPTAATRGCIDVRWFWYPTCGFDDQFPNATNHRYVANVTRNRSIQSGKRLFHVVHQHMPCSNELPQYHCSNDVALRCHDFKYMNDTQRNFGHAIER